MSSYMNIPEYEKLPTIFGDGFTLRPITWEDTEMVLSWRNADFVRNRFIFREPITRQIHFKWFHEKVRSGEVVQYTRFGGGQQKPLGCVYFQHFDREADRAEIGVFMAEEASGHGFGTRACAVFTDFAHRNLGIHSSYSRVLAGNDCSQKLFRSCGYQKEGVARDLVNIAGTYYSVIFYSHLSNDDIPIPHFFSLEDR